MDTTQARPAEARAARERLLRATIDVFAQSGMHGSTTKRIAQAAGVNEVTLFRHFGTKAELLREALGAAVREAELPQLPEAPSDPRRELVEWARLHLRHLHHNAALARSCLAEMDAAPEVARFSGALVQAAAADLRAYLGRLRECGWLGPEVPLASAARLLTGALFADAVTSGLLDEGSAHSLAEAPERYVSIFLAGIGLTASPTSGNGGAAAGEKPGTA